MKQFYERSGEFKVLIENKNGYYKIRGCLDAINICFVKLNLFFLGLFLPIRTDVLLLSGA